MSGNLLNVGLIAAVTQGDTKKVLDLLNQGADVDFVSFGHTALNHASSVGNIELVELLIMRGADVNLGQYPPLGDAIIHGHTEVVDLLLRSSANPNLPDGTGFTALHHAVKAERENLVKKLLERDVDYSIKNEQGLTALDLARSIENLEIITLIKAKMEADRKKPKGGSTKP